MVIAAVTNPAVEPDVVNVDGLDYTPIDLNADSAKQEWEKAISETNGNEFEAARNVYQQVMQGHYVNTSIGKVFISGSGWQEIKRGLKKDSLRAQTVPHIVEILKEGVVGAFDPNKKLEKKPNVTGYYPFTKTVEVDGKLVTALLKVEQKAKGEFVYHLRTSSDSTLDSTHENASLLRFMPDSLAFRELEEPTLDSIVEPNTGGVNIIILKVTDLEGNEIKELEDLSDEPELIEPAEPEIKNQQPTVQASSNNVEVSRGTGEENKPTELTLAQLDGEPTPIENTITPKPTQPEVIEPQAVEFSNVEILKGFLTTGNLSAALSFLKPLNKSDLFDVLHQSGFVLSDFNTIKGIMGSVLPQLAEAAKLKADGFDLQNQSIKTEVPQPPQNATADIDAEIETLRGLIGTDAFKPAMNSLLDKLEADNNEEYDTVIGEIINQHGAAKVAAAKGV